MPLVPDLDRLPQVALEGAVLTALKLGLPPPLRAVLAGVRQVDAVRRLARDPAAKVRGLLDAAVNPLGVGSSSLRKQVGSAVTGGALAGAAIGGTFALASNGVALGKGAKSFGTAALDTVKDTLGSAATGAAVGALSLATRSALFRAGATGVATGTAPVVIALTALDVGKDAARLLTGSMDGATFASNSGRHVAKGGCTWAGMEGGAALGTVLAPGLGSVAGALFGGIAGAVFGGWLTRAKP